MSENTTHITLICEGCNCEFESERKSARLCYKCLDKALNEVIAERDAVKGELAIRDKALVILFDHSDLNNAICPEEKYENCEDDEEASCDLCWINMSINQAKEQS